jgi:hypothetical protein
MRTYDIPTRRMVWLLMSVLALAIAAVTVPADGGETAKPARELTDDELGEKLQQAVLLAKMGFYGEAEKVCREILAQRPDQPTVKELLKQIESKKPKEDPKAAFRARLENTVFPEVRMREALVQDAIQFITLESGKYSPDKKSVNMVFFLPPNLETQRVSISVQNMSLFDLIKYITMMTNLRYYIDNNAVVIYHPSMKPDFVPGEPQPHAQPQ